MYDRILELNASDEKGIDTVREKIITFAKESISNGDPNYPSPPYKIIILDEADAITLDAQSALRKVIEASSNITRFCFTCNYIEKIIDPIISRCVKFRFKPIDKDSMISRLKQISIKENMKLSDKCYDKVFEISEGDVRRAIMILQNTKYLFGYRKTISVSDIEELVGSTNYYELESIWSSVINNKIDKIVTIAQDILKKSININELLHYLKDKIKREKIKDDIKSKIITDIGNTEGRLLKRGNEFLNILNLLSVINRALKN